MHTHAHARKRAHTHARTLPILALSTVGPGGHDTLVVISTPPTQILISKYHLPPREAGLLREGANSTAVAEKVQVDPTVSHFVESKEGLRNDSHVSKRHGNHL